MKYVIRSTDGGIRIPQSEIDAQRRQVVRDIVSSGGRYIEYSAHLGSSNDIGDRIEEQVCVIEVVTQGGTQGVELVQPARNTDGGQSEGNSCCGGSGPVKDGRPLSASP